ncbi:hypothetical protein BaRGS_00001878 [Batillaria attramentaria]|uniref:Uncharacterized protein n=1 Tax=Batillaria attramentaria TaxID=370345 RepID=A0ABD0M6U9_9CAEN
MALTAIGPTTWTLTKHTGATLTLKVSLTARQTRFGSVSLAFNLSASFGARSGRACREGRKSPRIFVSYVDDIVEKFVCWTSCGQALEVSLGLADLFLYASTSGSVSDSIFFPPVLS